MVGSESSQQHEQTLGRKFQASESDGSISLPAVLGGMEPLQGKRSNAVYEARVRLGSVSKREPVATSQDHAKILLRDGSRERTCSERSAAPTLADKSIRDRIAEVELRNRVTGLLAIDLKGKGQVAPEDEEAVGIILPTGSQLETRASAMSLINAKEKGNPMAAEAPRVPLRTGPKRFEERGKNLFEATKLRPEV